MSRDTSWQGKHYRCIVLAPDSRTDRLGASLAGTPAPQQTLNAFVDEYRDRYGVESICRVIQIAPSGYYVHATKARQPELRSARAKQDELLSDEVQRVWDDNMQCYGVVKVWKQLKREGIDVARCTVQRLMRRWVCRAFDAVK